ncbi:hypothetical protein A2U01_0064196, partial [Trifolium medium]|nr:hypothetical protein [Trifolium medium]
MVVQNSKVILTAQANDNHAPPVSMFSKALLPFKRIHDMSSPNK